uniref:Synaptogyrin 4 n=1 Tax=Ursus americanus TaxID=9643 RepID=A0A452R5V0_URSAM
MHIPESLQDLADSEAVQFLKRPKTITRIIAGVRSSCLSLIRLLLPAVTPGYQNKTESSKLHCVLNSNNVACSFAGGTGLLASFSCLPSSPWTPTRAAYGRFKDILWTGIWFVGFCFLANQWQHSPPKGFLLGSSSAKAAITFAFFSILIWIFQAYLALQDLRNDTPVPYKRSLDEGGVVLTTLSPPSAASPVNTPTTGPNNLSYAGSALSHVTTPKAPRLAMMPDN